MNEQDKEYLEKLYKGFAMVGFIISRYDIDDIPTLADKMAKAMMKEPSMGITAVEPKRRSK